MKIDDRRGDPIGETLRGVWQFRELSDELLGVIAATTTRVDVSRGAVILRQGDTGDDAYVCMDGRLEVRIDGKSGPVPVAALGAGELFGELAILNQKTRTASVVALSPVSLLRIDGRALAETFDAFPALRAQLDEAGHRMAIARFIKSATVLSTLSPHRLAEIAACVRERTATPGEVVIRQGDSGEEAFLVRSGELEVVDEGDGRPSGERVLAKLGPGMLFGEAALLTGAPRNATVRALGPVDLLVLGHDAFTTAMAAEGGAAARILGTLQARSRPVRRPGTELHERVTPDGATVAILKDPSRGIYFRLSREGLFLWERIDGVRTVRDLSMDLLAVHHVLAPDVVMEILQRLAASGFVELSHAKAAADGASRVSLARRLPRPEWQREFVRCDPFFTALYASGLRHLYSRPGAAAAAVLVLAGFAAFLATAPSVAGSLLRGGMFARAGIALLPLIVLAVVAHEFGHGLAAKAAGASVNRVGVGWSWLRPILSVDTSDAWLTSRPRRMLVDGGGLIVNVVLAGIAGLVAYFSPRSSATATLTWIFALWSYAAVLRDLNPLRESDGYYLLIDWLDRPNLRARSLAWLGLSLPAALRDRRHLAGHGLELLYGLGAVVYIALLTVWLVFVYRFTVQGWIARVVPAEVAPYVTQALALTIAGTAIVALIGEIRKERTNALGHVRHATATRR